jgi:hypothetical protein
MIEQRFLFDARFLLVVQYHTTSRDAGHYPRHFIHEHDWNIKFPPFYYKSATREPTILNNMSFGSVAR